MTREEAISFANMWLELNEDAEDSETYQFFKMAVSVLSADGEYIKKEDTIEYLNDLFGEMYHVSFGNVLQSIDSLQTYSFSNPTKNKGEWIKYGVPRCGEQHYKCTSCGYYINFGQWGELYTKEFKYCPNCGANMREQTEDPKNVLPEECEIFEHEVEYGEYLQVVRNKQTNQMAASFTKDEAVEKYLSGTTMDFGDWLESINYSNI